jgi:hypothetical protein
MTPPGRQPQPPPARTGAAGAALSLLIAALAANLLMPAVPAAAQGAAGDRSSLIQLGSRVFDFGTDVRHMRRAPHFIPVTDVAWINALVDGDPYLRPTVIHVNISKGSFTNWRWPPNVERQQYAPAEDLANSWGLDDYDVRWRQKVAPSNRGDIYLFPNWPDAGFFVSCGYDRKDPVPTYCAVRMLYPPDHGLRILVRVYGVTNPLNDFRAIIERARDLVYCLDVTKALEAGAREPLQPGAPQSLTEFLGTCRKLAS